MGITFTDSAVSNSQETTYNFTSKNIGTANASRWVLVGVGGTENGDTSAPTAGNVTVAGQSGSLLESLEDTPGGDTTVVAFYLINLGYMVVIPFCQMEILYNQR